MTALHAAAQIGQEKLLSFLIEAGAKVDACDSTGVTPLMLAAFHGHFGAVQILVDSRQIWPRKIGMGLPSLPTFETGALPSNGGGGGL